jgi:hypothetical protein
MKYPFCAVILTIMISNETFSQKDSAFLAHNHLYAEVGGAGGYGSVNYERVLLNKKYLTFALRLGIGTYHLKDYTNKFNPDLIVPFSLNGYYGKNHKLEIDLGQVLADIVIADNSDFQPKRELDFHSFFSIGYRYQKNAGGIVFRCMYSPIIEYNRYFRHWAGISIGYSF